MGVDLSLPLLRRVETAAPAGAGPDVVCADMRALPFRGGEAGFSVVVNFFTSFGYFESDDENFQAVAEIHRVLRPGGRYAIDLLNAHATVKSLEPRSERQIGEFLLLEERSFDPVRRRIEKRITLMRNDSADEKHYFESVRIFSEEEIRELLARAGLVVRDVLGDFTGRPYGEDTPRMIVLGSKPGNGSRRRP